MAGQGGVEGEWREMAAGGERGDGVDGWDGDADAMAGNTKLGNKRLCPKKASATLHKPMCWNLIT